MQVSNPSFVTANRNISNFAASFHVSRVFSHEHGRGWSRGTFEWDFNVIAVEISWVLGYQYAGGFEAFGPRWNFTRNRSRAVPFAGLTGGVLFSPHNFPPGPTYQTNRGPVCPNPSSATADRRLPIPCWRWIDFLAPTAPGYRAGAYC